MAEPIHRGGTWWHEQPDGSWFRFDAATGEWVTAPGPPPAPSADDVRAPPRPTPADATTFTPSGAYRSPARWAHWAVRLLAAAVILNGIAIVSDFAEISLLGRLESGDFTSISEAREAATSNDDRQATIGSLQLLIVLITAIPWLGWFRRAYGNLSSLGVREPRFTPGWAVGAWFVPFLNLVRPKQIADDLWRSTDPTLPAQAEPLWRSKGVHALVHWWWATWILSAVAAWIGAGLSEGENLTIDQLQTASIFVTLSDLAALIAGILAIRVVRVITARQEARAASLAMMGATVAPSGS
ncbi:MAG: DUF4328 domain-containing protein [Actinomycetota bacterium]